MFERIKLFFQREAAEWRAESVHHKWYKLYTFVKDCRNSGLHDIAEELEVKLAVLEERTNKADNEFRLLNRAYKKLVYTKKAKNFKV